MKEKVFNSKNQKIKNTANERGVTLVALGITIVILLIVAGISISMLTSDHGLINEATDAEIQTEIGKLQETTDLFVRSSQINKIKNHDRSGATVRTELVGNGVVTTVTTTDELTLGIYKNFQALEFNSELGKGGQSVPADWTGKITDLNDAFAINLKTKELYYVSDGKVWKSTGVITAEKVKEDDDNYGQWKEDPNAAVPPANQGGSQNQGGGTNTNQGGSTGGQNQGGDTNTNQGGSTGGNTNQGGSTNTNQGGENPPTPPKDEEGPVIEFVTNGSSEWKKEQSTVVNVTDTGDGVDEGSLKYQWRQETETPNKETFSDSFNSGETLTKSEGTGDNWYLWIYAKDKAGNETIESSSAFYLDNTPPTDTPPLLENTSDLIAAEIRQVDEGIGIDEATRMYRIKKTNQGDDEWGDWISDKETVHQFTKLQSEVSYDVQTKVADKLGQEKESQVASLITGEVTKPIISFTPDTWTNGKVTVTIRYTNIEKLTKQFSYDGNDWQIYRGPFEIEENGTTIYARSIDATGEGEDSVSSLQCTFIDKEPPKIDDLRLTTNYNLVAKATDTFSGINGYQFSTKDNINANSDGWTPVERTTEQIDVTYKAPEKQFYYFYVKDAAGNVSKEYVQATKGVQEFAASVAVENYGEYVNYEVDLNDDGDTKNDWKIFYTDGTCVYLIAADYLKNSKIPENAKMTATAGSDYTAYWKNADALVKAGSADIPTEVADNFNLRWSKANPDSTNANIKAVASLMDTEAWKSFAAGMIGAQAIGSPTLEMWTKSWNEKEYGTVYSSTGPNGYYIGDQGGSNNDSIDLSQDKGYNDELYFPRKDTAGYWIASPSVAGVDKLVTAQYVGALLNDKYDGTTYALRPVVRIPKGIYAERKDDQHWELAIPSMEITSAVENENYGDYISYDVDLNKDGEKTNDWRIFYKGKDYVYIIAADYLNASNVPTGTVAGFETNGTYGTYWPDSSKLKRIGSFGIKNEVADKFLLSWKGTHTTSTNANIKAVGDFIDPAVWTKFTTGIEGATEAENGIQAIGAPTLEMFVNSWNAKGYKKLDVTEVDNNGYFINTDPKGDGNTAEVSLADDEKGYNDTLYFPHKDTVDAAKGYWLTSPSASSAENLTNIDATGKVSSSIYSTSTLAVRPVVAIPSNILVQRNSQDLWQTGSNDIDSLKPTITLNTHSWAREVIVTIGYPYVEGIQREYSLTGEDGDWKTYTGPITLNKVEEEGKTIYARSVVGYNTATTSLTITNLDSAEPKELSLTAANLSTSTGKVVLTGTAKDSDSVGIQGWQITTDGEKTFDSDGWNPVSSKAEISQTFDTINKGTYYFYVKDKVGVSKTSVVVTDSHFDPMNISITAPDVTGENGWTNNNTVTASYTKIPGATYKYSTDGGSNWNDLSGTSFTIPSDGDYTSKLKAKAELGNVTKNSNVASAKYDKTAPTSLSISLASTSTTLTGTASDNSPSKIIGWAIDTTSTKTAGASGWTTVSSTSSISKTSTADLTGNAKNYYLHVKDEAGNVSNSSACGVHGQPTLNSMWNIQNQNSNVYHEATATLSSCTWKTGSYTIYCTTGFSYESPSLNMGNAWTYYLSGAGSSVLRYKHGRQLSGTKDNYTLGAIVCCQHGQSYSLGYCSGANITATLH